MKKPATLLIGLILSCIGINAIAQANISFTANPTTGCTPLTVTFTNTSTAPGAYRYEWIFNDGTPLFIDTLTTTISHTYVDQGTYSISMAVYNSFGGYLGTSTAAIAANGISSYDQLYLYPSAACPNQDVSINAPYGFSSYIFDYGDGVVETATTNWRNHKYVSAGNKIVFVTMLNACGGSNTLSDTVSIISYMPFPNWVYFSTYPNQACPNENVSFYTEYGYANYIWNFGDGNTDTTPNPNINHKYSSTGIYNTSVKIINFCGNDTMLYDTVNVRYAPFPNGLSLYINTQYSPNPVACPGEQMNFSAPWGFVYYVWNYGDGSPVDSGNASYKTHSYSGLGNYTASVKIRQTCGNDTILYKTVNIVSYTPFPNWVNLSAYPDPACPFKDINFNGPWGYPNYQWTWGDGTPLQTTTTSYKSHTYTSGGVYNVSLKVTNLCGNDTTLSYSVTIDPNLPFPTGNLLTINNGTPSCPGNVTFSANSAFQYYLWNFGDGNTQTTLTSTITHSYPTLGSYTVSVQLIDHCGNDTTVSRSLAVQYQPFPAGMQINVYSDNSCPGQDINFNAPWGYVSYKWNFGDGNILTGSNYVNHKYSAVGQYIVTVKIKQLCGNDTTISKIVKVINNQNFPNWITLTHYPNPACPGEPVYFYGPYGYPDYIWNFGDGTIDTNTNYSISHAYSTGGSFSVSVKVFNFCGLDTLLNSTLVIDPTLNISNPYLNVWFPNGATACPGEMVNFNTSWGFPNYTWDFGDGSVPLSGSFSFINYAYSEAGSYVVKVTIVNYCGNDTTVTQTITIDGNKPIGIAPTITINPGGTNCPDAPITLTGPTGFASYIWNFGDGSSPDSTTSNSVTHSYPAPGNYSATLKIINHCGNDATGTSTVYIDNTLNPNTSVQAYPNPICPNQDVVINAGAGFISYFWNFGDGFSAYGSNEVNHAYSAMGSYSASVIITNYCSNSDTFFTTITVDTSTSFPSWMNLWSNSWSVCPGDVTTLNTQPGFSYYFWNFGDGDTITTSGPSIGHTYSEAGTYSASVTLANGCGNSTTLTNTLTINTGTTVEPPQIYTALNSYCPGDAVMFLFNNMGGGAQQSEGAQNYTYFWNFGDGNADTTYGIGATHTYDSTGDYTTVVTITNKCGNSATKIVPVKIKGNSMPVLNSTLWGTSSQTNIVGCPGDAVIFYFQGTGSNLWNFGDGSTGGVASEEIIVDGIVYTIIKHAYSTAETYTVALTLTNGCGNSVTDSMSISIMSNLLVDGGLALEPPKGTNAYTTCRELNFIAWGGSSYQWDFGDGSALTTISPTVSHIYSDPGNYAISVLITNECGNSTAFSQAIGISQSGGPSIASALVTDATCFEGQNGNASISVSGGDAPYSYLWSDEQGQTNSIASNLKAGVYTVTVTDANNCQIDSTVTVSHAVEIELSTSSVNTACGSSSGSSTVNVTNGGNSPFTYLWTGGSTNSIASNLGAGTFTVTVTDADGCTASGIAAVSDNSGPAIAIDNITNVTCNGNSNGSVTITASGTNSPFTYLWTNGSAADDIGNLAAGNYSVTVSDTAGCKTIAILTITEPDELLLTFSTAGTQCGEANGSATVSVSGGTSSYGYLWDSNAGSKITATVTALSANAYRVTVTDAKSCTSVGIVTINNSNAPSLSVSKTNVSCPGLSDGTIDLTVTEGTTPYNYIWTWSGGGSFVQDLSGLDAGVYTVMVQDASNCWIGTSVTLTEPSFTSSVEVVDATCLGSSNGSATLTVNGGAAPYIYLWSNLATTNSITGLIAGTYSVQITDTNNCTVSDTASVSQPSALTITLSKTNVSCYGGYTGTAAASVAGGTSPYVYQWSTNSTATAISVLNAGTYIVTVSDFCSASKVDSITITQPVQLMAAMSKTNVSCYGGGNGTATVIASGGTSPYNYSWNNGQTTTTAYGLFPVIQSVNVFDANGCLASNNITVTQPQQLSATSSVSYVSCNAGSDGSVDATVSGGTSPYSFNWSNTATTEDVTGLVAGTYSVTITDSCSASVILSASITQPGALSLSKIVSDVKCNGTNNGSVSLTVSGGVMPYMYSWSNGATTEDIANLAPDTFTVTVTDACAQSKTDSAIVNQPATLTTSISKTNVSCYGSGNGTALVTPSGGTTPYVYLWNNNNTTSVAAGLFPGSYSVNVTDANACLASALVTISQPAAISATTSVSYVSCNAGSDGSVDVTVSGGTSPYLFNWSNTATTEDVTGLVAGTYSVTITDSCNASVVLSANITQPGALSLSKIVSGVTCNGANNGSASLTVSGGVMPYMYSWSNGASTEDISNLAPATYFVTVTDACAQSKTDSAIVSQPATLTTSVSKTNVSCYGFGNGTATVNAFGGTSPYIYQWNNGQTAKTAIGLFAGFYSVNVFDANTCLASNSVTITQPAQLSASAVSIATATCQNYDGGAAVTVTGGTLPYSYNWSSGGSSSTETTIAGGAYTVSVNDSKGCTASASVVVAVEAVTQQICIVTVDGVTNKNEIAWEKTSGLSTEGFIIYKEIATNVYDSIGFVPYDSLSNFIDLSSDPKTKSSKYKLATVDSCGNNSALGSAHKTMHLAANVGVNKERNLILESYEGFNFGQYRIWRGTSLSPIALIDSIVSTATQYSDWDTLTGIDSLFYLVEVVSPSVCNATLKLKTYNSSKSNTAAMASPIVTNIPVQEGEFDFNCSPNPYQSQTTITYQIPVKSTVRLEIFNVLGEKVKTVVDEKQVAGKYNYMFRASDEGFSQGVYMVKLLVNESPRVIRIVELK